MVAGGPAWVHLPLWLGGIFAIHTVRRPRGAAPWLLAPVLGIGELVATVMVTTTSLLVL